MTSRCQNACVYCYLEAGRTPSPPHREELPVGAWQAIHREIIEQKPRKVVVTGGEPMERSDILRLLRGFRKNDPDHATTLSLNTAGANITEQTAIALAGLPDRVRVSLDGPEAVNDRLRGKGSYRIARAALEFLLKAGFEPEASITATRWNLKDLPAFAAYLSDLGCRKIRIGLVRPIGRAEKRPDLVPNKVEFRNMLDSVHRRLGSGNIAPSADPPAETERGCGIGRYLNVLPDGAVYPCHVLCRPEFQLGNLIETRLREILDPKHLLYRLKNLDARRIGTRHPELRRLTETEFCLGLVWRETKDCRGWDTVFSDEAHPPDFSQSRVGEKLA